MKQISGYLKLLKAMACEYSTALVFFCISVILLIVVLTTHSFLTFNEELSNLVLAINYYGYINIPVNILAVYALISMVTNLYNWLLPLSLTFYFFIAREQKTLSESSLNLDNAPLRHFFLALIVFSVSGTMIVFLHDEKIKLDCILAGIYFLGASIFFLIGGLYFTYYFARNININYLLLRILKRAKLSTKTLLLKQNNCSFFRRKLYVNLGYLVDSIYQLLNQASIKGFLNLYRTKYTMWKEIIKEIFSGDEDRKDIELIYKNIKEYPALYKTFLNNQAALITSLYSNNKITEGYEALSDLFMFLPDGYISSEKGGDIQKEYELLMHEYLKTLCSLGLFFYKSNIILYPLILQIQGLPLNKIGIEKTIAIYRAWLIKAVESCDVKTLVCLSYAMMETVEKATISCGEEDSEIEVLAPRPNIDDAKNTKKYIPIDEINFYVSKALNIQLTEIESLLPQEKNLISDSDKNIGKCIYILLNAAVKSLEMSQYQCVGFIVKFIVSNFKSETTNPAVEQFISNKARDSKFDSCEIGGSFGLNSFNLNNKTDYYCLEKLLFLLYGQQVYIKTNNISIRHIPTEYINIQDYIGSNIKYIYSKIIAGKDKYGMVWLKDEKFHRRLFYSVNKE